jgi:hypothetical protein
MVTAKDILVKPIKSADGNAFVKAHHYSGKVAQNSQLHLGVFLDGRLHGVMQFGPSLDKRKIQGLVSGTAWHEFLELNRMAFDEHLPRNSESRALSIAWRLMRKHAPQVKWVISFADATQCGDGTIYRAAGFVLTGIKKNDQIWKAPEGELFSRTSLTDGRSKEQQRKAVTLTRGNASKGKNILDTGASSMKTFTDAGWKPLPGFQIRYIYFLDPAYRARLTVPELPYSEIEKRGASMYLGQKRDRGETDSAPQSNAETEGASPIRSLSLPIHRLDA